jgi:hypothetical protein
MAAALRLEHMEDGMIRSVRWPPSLSGSRRNLYLVAALAATLGACLFKSKPLTPEEQACRDEAMKQGFPDIGGAWATSDGKHKLNLRPDPGHKGSVAIAAAADSPEPPGWTNTSIGLSYPANPVCGGPFELRLRRDVPRPSALPATEWVQGRIDQSGEQLRIVLHTGEVWTRVGDAGTDAVVATTTVDSSPTAVELPPTGSEIRGVRLTGPNLTVIKVDQRLGKHQCGRACEEEWDCMGWTLDDRWSESSCELKAAVEGAQKAEVDFYSWIRPARVATMPGWERYARDTNLTGPDLRVAVIGWRGLDGCEKDCLADPACKAYVWRRAKEECTLKREVGGVELAEGATAWVKKPPPVPPDQTMTSTLCAAAAHRADETVWGMTTLILRTTTHPTTGVVTYHDDPVPYVTVTDDPATGPAYRLPKIGGTINPATGLYFVLPADDGTRQFTFRPVPGKGTVHLHSYIRPDLVLKRVGYDVVLGPPDDGSEWRIEHLWEHMDPPDHGVWYVIRSGVDGAFLATAGERLELHGSPAAPGTHWRFTALGNEKTQLPVQEPPPIKLDPVVVDRLAAWALKEYIRQEQPACWKKAIGDSCPASGQTTSCGAFCARTTAQCVLDVVTMVQSVTEVVANIAGAALTGGTANVALKAASTAAKAGSKAAARAALKQAMKTGGRALKSKLASRTGARLLVFMKTRGRSESFKKLARSMAKDVALRIPGKLVEAVVESTLQQAATYAAEEQERAEQRLMDAYVDEATSRATERLALRAAAGDDPDLLEIAAIVDPTGVMGVVDAFVKPMCEETPAPAF